MGYTTLGIDKIKKERPVNKMKIYLTLVEELESHSSIKMNSEFSDDNRAWMYRDKPEWSFYENDEDKVNYPYYFMMKARYILSHLKKDHYRYTKSIELKKYYGIFPDEFAFVKKNLSFINWCTAHTELKKYKNIIDAFYLKKNISMRKYVELHKDEGLTLKKLQLMKEKMFTTYIKCLQDNAFKLQLATELVSKLNTHPFSQDKDDLTVMKQRVAEVVEQLPTYYFEKEKPEN